MGARYLHTSGDTTYLRAHPRNSRNLRLKSLFMSKSYPSNQIPESSLTAQSVKSGIHRKTIQQPRAPLRVALFQGGERLILIVEPCKNRRNRRLRDVLSARQFLQFRKYVSSIRLFAPGSEHGSQAGHHERTIVGQGPGLLQLVGSLGILLFLSVSQAQIEASRIEGRIQFHR